MLKALIFDCDGVIANTEPLHFQALKQTLADEQIPLSEAEYYRDFLSFDDKGCFIKAFANRSQEIADQKLSELILRKANYFEPALREYLQIFPGVTDFIRQAAKQYPLAIASGARRQEIEAILQAAAIGDFFRIIVSTEDVRRGKPHPESFLKACDLLRQTANEPLEPRQCLVIEDSIHGVAAAHAAGMLCVAVTNSYRKELLSQADLVVESLETLSLEIAASLFDLADGI